MNPIEVLKEEHEAIERELGEFDFIMESDVINYSNLVHTFLRFCEIWDAHEEKEEGVFGVMRREELVVPVGKMTCEHKELRGHIEKIRDAINSGSDAGVRECLDNDLKVFVGKIREHMGFEDEILYTISEDELTAEEWGEMGRILGNAQIVEGRE